MTQSEQKGLSQGLSTEEAKRLLLTYGMNELPQHNKPSFLRSVRRILMEPMFGLLLAASAVYWLIGGMEDALILLGFVLISIGITVFQERRSENALSALKDLSSPKAWVIRDGERVRLKSRELVPGDLLVLEEGDRIAADGVLLASNDLLVDESLLTGESEPVDKSSMPQTTQVLIHSGTLVIRGAGTARVSATGLNTEIGQIGQSLHDISSRESPLQADIRLLIKRVAIYGFSLALAVVFIYGLTKGEWLNGLLSGISLTMALMPEELTVIMTVFMALGVWRISKQHVLARYAPVIETLGSINTLCVDKTGTLTQNKMSLHALGVLPEVEQNASESFFNGGVIPMDGALANSFMPSHAQELLKYAVWASEVEPFDPMEKAFHDTFAQCIQSGLIHTGTHGDSHKVAPLEIVHEYSLTPEFPAVTHVWSTGNLPESRNASHFLVAIKGSPELVMKLCPLSADQASLIAEQMRVMAADGLRMLGVAKAVFEKDPADPWPETPDGFEWQWLGLTGLKDPIRPEVPEAVRQCHQAGVRVVMITGDHALTAQAIAKQAGIPSKLVITGAQIQSFSEAQLLDAIQDTCIFVRVKPQQKLRLVNGFQALGQIVAMTGDGINDAPALKAAHVGISMGLRGTDVARESSSLVLMHDDFSSIVNAIRQGRQIYDNLQKAIIYVIAVHIPIAGSVFLPLILGAPPFLLPLHILFLEMIIDPTCAIVFEGEPPEKDVMSRPPRDLKHKIFSMNNIGLAVAQGLGLMGLVAGTYIMLLYSGQAQAFASTMAYCLLVIGNVLLIVVSRSQNESVIRILRKTNPAQRWIVLLATGGLMLISAVPFLQHRFHFTSIGTWGFLVLLALSALALLWLELVKQARMQITRHF